MAREMQLGVMSKVITLNNLLTDSSFENTTSYWVQYNSSYPATFTNAYHYKGSYAI
jgi:hypothetical protein